MQECVVFGMTCPAGELRGTRLVPMGIRETIVTKSLFSYHFVSFVHVPCDECGASYYSMLFLAGDTLEGSLRSAEGSSSGLGDWN